MDLKSINAVPAEERPLRDLLPDLNIANLMAIDRIDSTNQSHLHVEYLKDPLPNVQVVFTKPVPKPSFTPLNVLLNKRPVQEISPFKRYVEATEDELAERVEYDMDEQDSMWLSAFNERLQRMGERECSMEMFEFIMDQLEKEWFDLIKDIPKSAQDDHHFPEETNCAVCDGIGIVLLRLDSEVENSNAIVFCDGCNLAVHQDCYGVPFIPEGQWLCRKCMLSPEMPVQCILCPTGGGAYKKTSNNKWAHIVCSLWIPECHISNTVFMEPIEGVESIQKSRWKLLCFICNKKYGAPIQCANKSCFTAFHVTCARKAKLCMKMTRTQGITDSSQYRSYCERHTPKEYRDNVDVEYHLAIASEELSRISAKPPTPYAPRVTKSSDSSSVSKKKSSRTPQHSGDKPPMVHFSATTPIIPYSILKSITGNPTNLLPKKRTDMVITIAKYWALKKEARRGAALLKRLHLEPWTANASASKEEDEMKAQKYEILATLRKDLERVRILLDMVRRRERQKLKIAKLLGSLFEYSTTPLIPILQLVLEKLKVFDKMEIFHLPVSLKDVPDYLSIITQPMDFSTMSARLKNNEYASLDDFENDVFLICNNCILYNKPETIFAKTAHRLRAYYEGLIPVVREQVERIGVCNGEWKEESHFKKDLLEILLV